MKQEEIDFKEDVILYDKLKALRKKKAKIVRKSNKKLNKKLSPIEQEIYDKESELIHICSHRKTKKEYTSVEGGYLNTGSHTTNLRCLICNVIIDSVTVNTGF